MIDLYKKNKPLWYLWMFAAIALLFEFSHVLAQEAKLYRVLPFPENLKRYDTQLFRLVDPTYSIDPSTKHAYYDRFLASQFKTIIAKHTHLDANLRKKLLSGPASRAQYIEVKSTKYIFYTLCQAHWCNVTNVSVLFQPDQQRIVGRLLYACESHGLGEATKDEIQVINQLNPMQFDEDDCKLAKRGK